MSHAHGAMDRWFGIKQWPVAFALAAAAALAGCGGGGGGSGGGTATIPEPGDVPTVSSLTLTPEELLVTEGNVANIELAIELSDGSTGRPRDNGVVWTSADPDVATVSATGNVTADVQGAAFGRTDLTVAFGGKEQVIPINVGRLRIDLGDVEIAPGVEQPLRVRASFADGRVRDVTGEAVWTSSDGAIASILIGEGEPPRLRGEGEGTAVIRAEWRSMQSASRVTIVPDPSAPSLVVTPATIDLAVGESGQLRAFQTAGDADAEEVTADATWRSSDPGVVQVDGNGQIEAFALAEVTIKAERDGLSAESQVRAISAVVDGPVGVLVTAQPNFVVTDVEPARAQLSAQLIFADVDDVEAGGREARFSVVGPGVVDPEATLFDGSLRARTELISDSNVGLETLEVTVDATEGGTTLIDRVVVTAVDSLNDLFATTRTVITPEGIGCLDGECPAGTVFAFTLTNASNRNFSIDEGGDAITLRNGDTQLHLSQDFSRSFGGGGTTEILIGLEAPLPDDGFSARYELIDDASGKVVVFEQEFTTP